MTSPILCLPLLLAAALQDTDAPAPARPLKVFLLAGQSNMEGQAVVDLDHEQHYNGGRGILASVLDDPEVGRRFGRWRDERGQWVERDDVWVWYQPHQGPLKAGELSIGYAVYEGRHHFGPEMELGRVLGDHFEEQVLLVKTAWGGKSLVKDFRPPRSAGETGEYYLRTLREYRDALTRLAERFPEAASLRPELSGFFWFQGWNDMSAEGGLEEYEENLSNLIKDLREEFDVPRLPVVIGQTGNADNEDLWAAQEGVSRRVEFEGRVAYTPTRSFLRDAQDSPNVTHGHHWFGNAESYLLIGEALGNSMLELLRSARGDPTPLPAEIEDDGQAQALPNVVLIYSDDQGFGDCSAYNQAARFKTPNMDRLAAEGVRFTDGHAAGTVCTPSRYALLTGRYAWRTSLKRGVLGADSEPLIQGRATLADLLGRHGYTSAAIGKWHLGMDIPGKPGERDWSRPVRGGPLDCGFDHFFGIPASMNFGVLTWFEDRHALAPASMWTRKRFPESEIQSGPKSYRMAPPFDLERQGGKDVEVAADFADEHALRVMTERAVGFIKERAADARRGEPFFLYLALTSPHLPHCVAPEFQGRSQMGQYGDFMLETDHRVGQVLEALDEQGLSEHTLVFFSSDNGPETNYKDWQRIYGHLCAGGLRGGKRDLFEGGHRVPFLIRWPAVVRGGRVCHEPVCQVDLYATLADILDVTLADDEAVDSFSLLPALRSEDHPRPLRGPIVHHSGAGYLGVRDGPWKLLMKGPADKGTTSALYDLGEDRTEERDVATEREEVVGRLTLALTKIVQDGRSRPGPPDSNDGGPWWPQLTWIEASGD